MKNSQDYKPLHEEKTSSRGGLRRLGAVLLALALVMAVGLSPAYAAGQESDIQLTRAEAHEAPMSTAEVYAATVNSTVGIRTSVTTNYFGYETQAAAAGSGFIITEDGYILTNYHVVEDSNSITVTTYDGSSYDAALIGYDASNDIAVLKIEAEGLSPVIFGDSDELVVGQDVLAIGNPLGELTFSLTRGIVSALNREITLSGNLRMKLIQTDCAINAGNSGGALFNYYGEVVGITNAKYSGSGRETSVDNIGFAIPVNTVLGIVEQIMTSGQISSPYIGVTVSNVSEDLLAYGVPAGANINSVTEDSPAAEAGLQERDVITAVDGQSISSFDALSDCIRSHKAGDTLKLSVYRQGETLEISVVVGENVKPALPEPTPTPETPETQPGENPGSGEHSNGGQMMPFSDFDEFYKFFFG